MFICAEVVAKKLSYLLSSILSGRAVGMAGPIAAHMMPCKGTWVERHVRSEYWTTLMNGVKILVLTSLRASENYYVQTAMCL